MRLSNKVIMAERSDIYLDVRVQKEASSLTKNGYEVTLYGFRSSRSVPDYKFIDKIRTFFIFPRTNRLLRVFSIAFNIFLINIIIIFKKGYYYHAHNTMFLLSMYVSSKIHKGIFIYDCHEVQWEASKLSGLLEKLFINRADVIINVSEGRAKLQAEKYRVNPSKIKVICNYPIKSINAKNVIKNTDKELRFIYCGGFSIGTNRIDNLLIAISRLTNVSVTFLGFGYGNSEAKVKSIIEKYNLFNKVRFLPLVSPDRVIDIISEYDVAVNLQLNPKKLVSYRYHAMNKIYEYFAAGLPLLLSDMPSFINEFEHLGTAIFVNPNNIESVINGVKFCLLNRDNIYIMGSKALAISKERYNWSTQEIILLDIYSSFQKKNKLDLKCAE